MRERELGWVAFIRDSMDRLMDENMGERLLSIRDGISTCEIFTSQVVLLLKSYLDYQEIALDLVISNPAEVGDTTDAKWLPNIDMLFDNKSEAYDFYNTFAEKNGFFVRRPTLWTTSKNIITRRTFVCSKEGFKEKSKGVKESKCPRIETRICCPACMIIRLTPNGKYCISDFAPNHNHQLAFVSTIQMFKAKKLRCKNRAERSDLVDDTVRTPEFETEEEAYEFYSMYAARVSFTVRRASLTVCRKCYN